MTKVIPSPRARAASRRGGSTSWALILVLMGVAAVVVMNRSSSSPYTDVFANLGYVTGLGGGSNDPLVNPAGSYITWCHGKTHLGPGRCASADNVISVTRDLEVFQLLLKRAMDARREMTPKEHDTLAAKFNGKPVRNNVFAEGNPGAYHVYSLYGHALTTPGMVNADDAHLWLEFGVFTGASVNLTTYSQRDTGIGVHGFDTFTGLPEAWIGHHDKGHFDQGGVLPPVEAGAELHKGLFSESLPPFLSKNGDKKIAGMNVDCDLYQGAIESLKLTYPYWTTGTMLHFHELQQSPKSREVTFAKQEEVTALHEFLVAHPGTVLEMLPIRNSYAEPVVFSVVS